MTPTSTPFNSASAPGVWALDTFPDLLAVHRRAPARYPCLLETAAPGPAHARYDILFALPRDRLVLGRDHVLMYDRVRREGRDFLSALDESWRAQACVPDSATALPFSGGWCLYLGYGLAAQIEPRIASVAAESDLPIAVAIRCPAAIVRDHHSQRAYIVAENDVAPECIEQMRRDAMAAHSAPPAVLTLSHFDEEDPQRFLDGVARVRRYIEAGDVFQVNLSRRWRAQASGEIAAADVYDRLRRANPAPFAGLLALTDDLAIVSSSPERLVRVRDGEVSTRPIAGTWPRSDDVAADGRAMESLLAHPKERAEHVMLLDLERNDLGRVCQPGTVRVTELMHVETYRYVHHLVSEVSGRVRSGISPGEIVRAVFPGGTITGCPKVRCMEIIEELEREPRGAYTGALGYLNRDGSLDLNILIRTLTLDRGHIELRAGSGIVADSDPQRELAETRAKARGLLAALGMPT